MKKIALQLLIGLILIAAIWIGISTLNRNFSQMFNPLAESSHAMSTQISDLLHPTPTILPDPVDDHPLGSVHLPGWKQFNILSKK